MCADETTYRFSNLTDTMTAAGVESLHIPGQLPLESPRPRGRGHGNSAVPPESRERRALSRSDAGSAAEPLAAAQVHRGCALGVACPLGRTCPGPFAFELVGWSTGKLKPDDQTSRKEKFMRKQIALSPLFALGASGSLTGPCSGRTAQDRCLQ
jgi:hypothetical protein